MENEFIGTTQEFADEIGADYILASGLLRFLKEFGKAKIIDKRPAKGGRGKPSDVYSVPRTLELRFRKYTQEFKSA